MSKTERTVTEVVRVNSFDDIPAVINRYTQRRSLITFKVEEYDTEYDLIFSWNEEIA